MKQSKAFYLSVEGETEKWYFEHLCTLINSSDAARYKLKLKCYVEKEPLAIAKRIAIPPRSTINIWHVFDFESESEQHRHNFQVTLRQMRDANKMGKKLCYHNAYSNFTFDLWMVLHRQNVVHCGHRRDYVRQINSAFDKHFSDMDEFKKEANFKNILSNITLDDVRSAIQRAKRMNKTTDQAGARTAEYCGWTYRLDNPYTRIYEPVEWALKETKLL